MLLDAGTEGKGLEGEGKGLVAALGTGKGWLCLGEGNWDLVGLAGMAGGGLREGLIEGGSLRVPTVGLLQIKESILVHVSGHDSREVDN